MRRWSGIAGIVFVVLAVVSRLVRGSHPDPTKNDALRKFASYYANKTNNSHALLAFLLGSLGLFAFAWFIGGVWSALRNAEGGATMPTIVVAIGGATYVAAGLMYHVLSEGPGITVHFGKGYVIDPGTALLMTSLGTGAFLSAMLAAGVTTAGAGVVIVRTRAFPVWLGWFGFAVTVLCLPMIPALATLDAIVLAIWALVTSFFLITTSGAS